MKTCKTMVEKNKPETDFSNTLENLFHKYDSYCCPYCSSLPEILSFNEGNGMIKLKCKKHGENTLGIKDYLQNMTKFVSTSELNFKNKCTQHKNEPFTYYCTKCEESLCQSCFREFKKNHEEHNKCLYNIESLTLYNIDLNFTSIENIFNHKKLIELSINSITLNIDLFNEIILRICNLEILKKINLNNLKVKIDKYELFLGFDLLIKEIKNLNVEQYNILIMDEVYTTFSANENFINSYNENYEVEKYILNIINKNK